MANTSIQIKFSEANSAPTSLNVAEPAYSYTSNTLFIGTPDSTGAIAIGGKSYVDLTTSAFAKANSANILAQSAYDAANAAGSGATITAAFAKANAANILAQAGFDKANTANVTADAAFAKANSANVLAQQAYDNSNTKLSLSGGTITGPISGLGNSKLDFTTYGSNTAYLTTTNDDSTALFMGAGSAELYANTSVTIRANTKGTSQNWTFGEDGSLTLPASGIISGLKDVNITGNLTVVGTTTYANTQTVLIADNILTLNAAIGQSAQPLVNAGIEVDRGAQPNSQFLWIESSGKWSANNGNGSIFIAADSAESYANAAFLAANNAAGTNLTQNSSITAAFNTANASFLQANTPSYVANSAATYANAAFTAANSAGGSSSAGPYANAAFAVANSAASYANAAFTAANTAGGSVQGNTITLGANTVGQLVSNAVTLTTETTVTNGLSLLNNVLGKLVPPGPPAFPSSNTISIASVTSYRMTNFTQTDRTSNSRGVAAGTTVTNARRAATYSITPTIPDQGPGDSGTITLFVNGANSVARTFTSASANGTYTSGNHSLVISDSVDYGSKIVGTAQGFWRSFDCSANGTVSNGWNELFITHSGASSTNTPFWYYDDSAPGTVTINNGSLTVNSAAYSNSSTIPHYTNATLFNLGFNISKLSGDMYPTSDTFVASAAGGAFGANSGVTYAQAGITTPLVRNLYVSSGQATVNLTSAIVSGFGNSATGVVVTGQNSYTAGTLSVTPGVTIQYKTGNTSSNTVIGGEDNLFFGSTVGTGSTAAFRIINPGSADNPAYANGASAFNSTSSTLEVYDATIVAGTLKHDVTNYSTGYLPVGPNLSSGRTGPQYFTFKFVRTSLSKFDIQFTGNTAGVWVAAPGTVIDSTSSLNGWLSMTTAYAGSGIPGANAPGNGSNGCALGGTITANTAVTTHRKTCTFGTVSTSNSTANEVYVRIKLLAGQTITALSLQTANN